MKKIALLLIAFVGFAITTNAQVTGHATVTGTIVKPISIINAGDMNFGNVAVSATAGTVVLDPAGTRTPTLGVTLPANHGTVTPAIFNISGVADYTYSITLPVAATSVDDGNGHVMTVDSFVSNPSGTGKLDAGGKQTINIGATWNVGANQAAGVYVSATPFDVTVNYN
jgi:hypothetical protein